MPLPTIANASAPPWSLRVAAAVCAAIALVVGASVAEAAIFELNPHQVVSSSGWMFPERVLGPRESCPGPIWAIDPTGTGPFLEVQGWDPFSVPPGQVISRVAVNALGHTRAWGVSVARVRGSVEPQHTSTGANLYNASSECQDQRFYIDGAGWDVTRYRSIWEPQDIENLIVGVRLVENDIQPPDSMFIDAVTLTVETSQCHISPEELHDFGTRLVGSTSDWTFRIYNVADGAVEGDVQDQPPFLIADGEGPYSLGNAEFRSVTVRFAPTSAGVFDAEIGGACGAHVHGVAMAPATGVGDPPASIPEITRISPHPFRTAVDVDFALPRDDEVALSIVDVAGRRLRSLERQRMSAGVHRSAWDGRTDSGLPVAAGIYFVRLQVGARSWTKTIARVP